MKEAVGSICFLIPQSTLDSIFGEETMPHEWTFADVPNTAVITLRQIMFGAAPILCVYHCADDGGWEFLGWDTPAVVDAILVSLSSVVERDPTITKLADLPVGWRAWRRHVHEEWIRVIDADS